VEKGIGSTLFTNTIKKVGKSCIKYHLLEPGDKVLVGISGGKDSIFLLEALHWLNLKLPTKIEFLACHIHIKDVGYKTDLDYIRELCRVKSIPFIIEELSVSLTENPKKAPCFVCSWHRRKRLFELAKEYNCNKLALGHHADDAIETLFINMVYHGSISSMPACLKMFNGRMNLIRPLIEMANSDIQQIAVERNYPTQIKDCPYGNLTHRTTMRGILDNLNGMSKNAKKNIFRSMSKIFTEYLPDGK